MSSARARRSGRDAAAQRGRALIAQPLSAEMQSTPLFLSVFQGNWQVAGLKWPWQLDFLQINYSKSTKEGCRSAYGCSHTGAHVGGLTAVPFILPSTFHLQFILHQMVNKGEVLLSAQSFDVKGKTELRGEELGLAFQHEYQL